MTGASGIGLGLRKGSAIAAVLLLLALLAYGLIARGQSGRIDERLAATKAPLFNVPVLEQGRLPLALRGEVGKALSSENLVSHHLRVLRETGLAQSRREGKMVMYSLTATGHQLLAAIAVEPASSSP